MDSSVFFWVAPIWWQGSMIWEAVWLSCFIIAIFFIYIKHRKSSKSPSAPIRKHIKLSDIPDTHHDKFISESFLLLQNFVLSQYAPKNAPAHTSSDIKKYCKDSQIIQLWEELEHAIYTASELSLDTKRDIYHRLSVLIWSYDTP